MPSPSPSFHYRRSSYLAAIRRAQRQLEFERDILAEAAKQVGCSLREIPNGEAFHGYGRLAVKRTQKGDNLTLAHGPLYTTGLDTTDVCAIAAEARKHPFGLEAGVRVLEIHERTFEPRQR